MRDELHFLLGRDHYWSSRFDDAIKAFERVSPQSPLYLEATFFVGVTSVRRYRAPQALVAFKKLLVIGRDKPRGYLAADIARFEELARLQLARLFYSTKQYELASKYYGQITRQSPNYQHVLREMAWVHLMTGRHAQSVEAIHALRAPFSSQPIEVTADYAILESFIYHQRCLYGPSLRAARAVDPEYRPVREELEALLEKFEDDTDLFGYSVRATARAAQASTTATAAAKVIAHTLDESMVKPRLDWARELDRELRLLEGAPAAWQNTPLGTEVLEDLALQQALARADVGKAVRMRLERHARELREFSRDSIKLRIENIEAMLPPRPPTPPRPAAAPPRTSDAKDPAVEGPAHADADDAEIQFDEDEDEDEDEIDFDEEIEPDEDEDGEDSEARDIAPTDPRLREAVWEFASDHAGSTRVMDANHLVWKFNRGFARSKQGDYRYRLTWSCPSNRGSSAPPTPKSEASTGREPYDFANDTLDGELLSPDSMPNHMGHWEGPASLIRIRQDFVREILEAAEQLRARRTLQRPR